MKFSTLKKGRMPAKLIDYLILPCVQKFPESTLTIKQEMMLESDAYEIGKISTYGEELQLVMLLEAYPSNKKMRKIKALIDTGAEANLVKRGLFERRLFGEAEKPVQLIAANGQRLGGGTKTIKLDMGFNPSEGGSITQDKLWYEAECYEADINIDVILSYPWMCKNKIGIFPHHKALVVDDPRLMLLYGEENGEKREKIEGSDLECLATRIVGYEGQKYSLVLPSEGMDVGEEPLSPEEVEDVMQRVCSIIEARESNEPEDPRVEGLREKIFAEYEGVVFASKVIPDPPERGQYGYAYIALKEGAVPIRQKPFMMHGERHEAYKKVVEDWIENKYIERPTKGRGEWLSQGFVVPKKGADFPWRGVADLRGPNSQTLRCNYPLPRIDDILIKQGACHIFSIVDLKQAFHQQPLHPDSRHITCIHTPFGIYQWRVNVMGLTNAPQQFQQMLDDRLMPVKDVADPYIDDIIVGTRVEPGEDGIEKHEKDLRRVLDTLKADKLICDRKKCKLFVKEVEWCGHILGGGTRRPAPGKLMAIEKWEVPRTITELRKFLGFTNYYNSYIQGYSEVVGCLQDKLKVSKIEGKKGSKVRITWTEEDQKAFEEIKRRLCSNLLLQRVNPDKPFVLRVDASAYAVGASLEQLIDEDRMPTSEDVQKGRTVPVAFLSRKLASNQRNWAPREIETYAIIVALQKWENWIGLQPVLVLTDHKAIESWAREVLDPPSGPVGRRARWHQIFSKYDLTVGYIPGKDNDIADILSRWAYPASQAYRDISKHGSKADDDEMNEIIRQEKLEEAECMVIKLKNPKQSLGVTTRSGRKLNDEEEKHVHFDPKVEENEANNTRTSHESWAADPSSSSEEEDDEEDDIVELSEPSSSANLPPMEKNSEEDEEEKGENPDFPPQEGALERGPEVTMQKIDEIEWGKYYEKCPTWSNKWGLTHNTQPWPEGVQILQGKMYFLDKLCVPTELQAPYIRLYHDVMGHVGVERLWADLNKNCVMAKSTYARKLCSQIARQCEICQASNRISRTKGPVEFTPIPPNIMTSVAIDLFRLPTVKFEGKTFDSIIACVDRHSGWIVAIPVLNKGLTGAKVAQAMLAQQWQIFGVPSVITSDQGSHFISSWWQTLCASLGIRQAYSQVYHHSANGRAEVAGQQIMEILRKLYTQDKINWVEALPRVLARIHDVKGESGLSPYEILFGRTRSLGNMPYTPPKECEDANTFISRMTEVDRHVANRLNEVHAKIAEKINEKRVEGSVIELGSKVWYRRPEGSGEKLDSRWLGPAIVTAREGKRSYVIELKAGVHIKAHRSFLKEYVEDIFNEKHLPLFYFQRTELEGGGQVDEWLVDKVIGHKIEGNKLKFLTTWEGHAQEEATWEDAKNFLPMYNVEFVKYCKEKGIQMDLVDQLGGL